MGNVGGGTEDATAGVGADDTSTENDNVIARRIGEWQTRLLQLNRRNNLLYFKPGRSSVGITGVAPDALGERLQRSRTGLSFPHVPPRRTRRRGFAMADAPEPDHEPRAIEGDLRTDCEPLDLQRRLRGLRRKDREWEDEQGLNVLFLAVGFLNWIDADGEGARSPLVLIPCDLDRASPRDAYRLRREDDDPVVNPTLRHQLAEYGVQLPDFAVESGEADETIEAYIGVVGELVRQRPSWSVESSIVLGAFSYSKLAMYEDLERMREQGVRSELTRLLAGGDAARDKRGTGAPSAAPRDSDLAGGGLDDQLDLRDQYAVLSADFSQLRAIEQARMGRNLVIHGPPGTGKSQTIANLIATLLADGKRVLFVSEKTAALDVVKRRLEECGLGVFCLDLHSDRGRKSEVYKQLKSATQDRRDPVAQPVDADELIELRNRLNRIVRLLHRRREPLGQSVYKVQGRFERLRQMPRFEEVEVPGAADLTPKWIFNVTNAAQRIAARPEEFRSHNSSRWLPLRTPQSALQLPDEIRDDMNVVQAAIKTLREGAAPHSEWLGLPAITEADDVRSMARLLLLLARAPGVPPAWLDRDAVKRLRQLAREQADQQRTRERLVAVMSGSFGGQPPPLDYRAMASAAALLPAEREVIEGAVGAGWRTTIGGDPAALSAAADALVAALGELSATAAELSARLGGAQCRMLSQIDEASRIAGRILDLDPVPARWLSGRVIDDLKSDSESAHSLLEQLGRAEQRLNEDFSDALVDLVDEEMLVRYRTDYQSFWRRHGGAHRRDQRTLRGQLKTPHKLSLSESLDAVKLAVDVKRQRGQWREMEPGVREALGARFRGRATDWERVLADVAALRCLLVDWRGDAAVLRELLAVEVDGGQRRALNSASRPLDDALVRYRHAADTIDHDPLTAQDLEVAAADEAVRRALEPLRRVSEGTAGLYERLAQPPDDFSALTALIENGARLMAVKEEDERFAPALTLDFGHFFKRELTDWVAVSKALDWTEEVLREANGRVSDELRRHATKPQPRDVYDERAEAVSKAADAFAARLRVLDQRFNLAAIGWRSWDAPRLDMLEAWGADLGEHAGSAPGWVAYQGAVRDFDERLGAGAAGAVRALTERAEDVPDIVSRRIYAAWLEDVYKAEPELREFNRADQERVRSRFRELDERFPVAARQRVRERAFAKYPEWYSTPLQSGQLGTLNGELSKQRRQMPVRRLIHRIPNLLQTLKPVFLMSPLAVSQYLPAGPLASDHLDFDAVIFDEASQVLPEDALPAIERARQVIVVGDRLQLPPTSFFQRGLGDDEDVDRDDDEAEDAFEGRESILDVMVGQVGAGIAERYLSVHYRSRCESLIRFSNHAFYDNRLLTFPGPDPAAACVQDMYLPGATYDAGGSKTNRGEAERVTDIVFDLMANRPLDESVGVVALSRSQADLIERLIEERRLLNRHLDDRFSENLDERFFVKNLENVQGDERDHMILSIGYGPTRAGAVPNRFGPINQEGGERRLNVAVTRARMSMTVIHSLRAEDITSPSAGARQLRRYLEYVRNPEHALEAEVTGVGEPESPFEEAVLAALRSRGHRVEAQVGVSGYRIDLAIRSEEGGRFDLGIECDGWTYHNSPAARDRDWLRQQILEGLGWRIHRVLSTAWIHDPETEIAALEHTLAQARADLSRPPPTADRDDPDDPPDDPSPAPLRESPTPTWFFDEYRRFEHESRRGDLLRVPWSDLVPLVRDVVEIEQPVHTDTVIDRVRTTYVVHRAGTRIRARIRQAIKQAPAVRRKDGDDAFLCLAGESGPARPRRADDRAIGRIAAAELDEGLLLVARKTFGCARADLVRETARQFGYRRTGRDIAARLEERIERLVESGRLSPRGDMLVASDAGA